jgi:hypothetical protein
MKSADCPRTRSSSSVARALRKLPVCRRRSLLRRGDVEPKCSLRRTGAPQYDRGKPADEQIPSSDRTSSCLHRSSIPTAGDPALDDTVEVLRADGL